MSALIPFIRRQTMSNWPNPFWAGDFDRLFEPVLSEPTFRLQGDIYETDEHIMMSFDIPGLKEEDFKIAVDGEVLSVTGERKRSDEAVKKDGVSYYGRQYGKFSRAFKLPDTIDKTKIDADYRDGVLRVLLPKMEVKKENAFDVKVKSKNSVFDKLLSTK